MWKDWGRAGGCCSTTWISSSTCSILNCESSTSWSDSGETPRCSRQAPWGVARNHEPDAMDRGNGGGAGARLRAARRGAVLRAEQGPIPHLRFSHHPDGALRHLLLPGRAGGRARRGPHCRALVRTPLARAPPEFQGRKPILLYASHSDFQQTNAIGGDIGEGTGGVTEFFKHRMVLPFTGAYEELEHVIGHEMVHQFQYDVFSRGRIGAGVQTLINVHPPRWFMEGMAEYLSIAPLDPHTTMWLRDAALEGHLPTTEQLTYDPRIFPYRFGHALFAYVGERWGDE